MLVQNDPLTYRLLAIAGLAVVIVFIGLFSREPWWRQPFGRSLMFLAVSLGLFELATALRQWFGPEYPGRQVVRYTAQIVMLSSVVAITVELIRARRKRSHDQPV